MDNLARPYRSVLYIPGSNERALEKAKTLPVDAIIFDLEDAVAVDAKAGARSTLAAALAAGGYGQRFQIVRLNGMDTEWGAADLETIAAIGPQAVLLPKVGSAAEIEALAASVPDSGGVAFVPAFAGLGAPHWDPYARGTLLGLTRGSHRGHIARATLEDIRGGDAEENAQIARDLLAGALTGPKRDVVLLTAAAALSTEADDFTAGLAAAQESIDSGAAADVLARYIAKTKTFE